MSSFWWWPFSFLAHTVPGISAWRLNTLVQEAQKPVLLVDVRSPGEFASGHIRGAVNVPLGQLDGARISEMAEQLCREKNCQRGDVEVVCICLSAHRSPPAVRLIKSADPSLDVKQLDYGMANWWMQKYESVKE